jgi:hypothetical protein
MVTALGLALGALAAAHAPLVAIDASLSSLAGGLPASVAALLGAPSAVIVLVGLGLIALALRRPGPLGQRTPIAVGLTFMIVPLPNT